MAVGLLTLTACGGGADPEPASTPATPKVAAPKQFPTSTRPQKLLTLSFDLPAKVPFKVDRYGNEMAALPSWTYQDEAGLVCSISPSVSYSAGGWPGFDDTENVKSVKAEDGKVLVSGSDPDAPAGAKESQLFGYSAPGGSSTGRGSGFKHPYTYYTRAFNAGSNSLRLSVAARDDFTACDPKKLVASMKWDGRKVTPEELAAFK